MAMAPAASPGPKSVVTLPPMPKVVSTEPSCLKRASTNSDQPRGTPIEPATMIFPSGWIAEAPAERRKPDESLYLTLPLTPNVRSKSPSAACREIEDERKTASSEVSRPTGNFVTFNPHLLTAGGRLALHRALRKRARTRHRDRRCCRAP